MALFNQGTQNTPTLLEQIDQVDTMGDRQSQVDFISYKNCIRSKMTTSAAQKMMLHGHMESHLSSPVPVEASGGLHGQTHVRYIVVVKHTR